MNILYYSQDIDFPSINKLVITQWVENVICHYKQKGGNINFIFCNDNYILDINKKFLNHDYYTDIITFNYSNSKQISGDLFISLDTVLSNSEKFKSSFFTELHRVMIHGVLHLLGFNDKSKEEELSMRENEDYCLKLLDEVLNDKENNCLLAT